MPRYVTALFVLVIILATALGAGTSIWWFMRTTPEATPATIIRIPSLVPVSSQVPVELRSTQTDTLAALQGAMAATRDTTQFYLTSKGSSTVPLPANTGAVLSTLAFRAPGSFIRSIQEIDFGAYAGEPYIVIKATDFNTAFAGMLGWETTMSQDLSVLFAPSSTLTSSTVFRDTVAANVSTRVLSDTTGTERIIYGFVKPDIILITPSRATFEALVPLVSAAP
jgi:hypothetical protein